MVSWKLPVVGMPNFAFRRRGESRRNTVSTPITGLEALVPILEIDVLFPGNSSYHSAEEANQMPGVGGHVNVFIKITGTTQGVIKGESTNHAFKDQIEVYSYEWGVKQAYDVATGQSSGKRQYQTFKFLQRSQKSTPLLLKAVSKGEVLKEVLVSCCRPNTGAGAGGGQVMYMKWILTNAKICNIRTGYLWDLMHASTTETIIPYDAIEMTFQKIELDYSEGNLVYQDDWGMSQT